MSTISTSPSELQLQQALRVAIAATDRGDYAGAMKVFKAIYDDPNVKAPVDGLSAYGLCVAMEDRQTRKGIELCRAAIASQFYDSRHYCNLISLHLRKSNRKAAVETLEEAMGRLPQDAALLAMREKMGYREPSPISFLSRDNFLNRILARRNRGNGRPRPAQRSRINFRNISPLVAGALVLIFFAAVFGGTFLVLYQQAYK